MATDLRDITEHPLFVADSRPGTYSSGTCGPEDRLRAASSPKLWAKVTGGAIFRMGVWGGVNGTLFPRYDTMTEAVHAASDHAAIYADLDLD